jgi:hypothetical protein
MQLDQVLEQIREQDECDTVESVFLRDGLSPHQRGEVFRRVVAYYKDKPSADRARLLQDLTNEQASQVAGISSRTMAKARKGDVEPKLAAKRQRTTKSGMTSAEVREIVFQACMDPRFCEVRSWVSHAGNLSDRHWECVGLVDIKTIWRSLCETHGDFCSLRTFYDAMPDFFVHKKKERCVCNHCKKGRRVLDNTTVIINALRRSVDKGSELCVELQNLRLDLLLLHGHLDKEIVIDVADGRHRCDTEHCDKCSLLRSLPQRLAAVLSKFDGMGKLLSITAQDWAIVFPGIGLSSESGERLKYVVDYVSVWEANVKLLVDHLLLKADRIKALEADIDALRDDPSREVWFADYAMSVKLIGTFDETEADFLSKDVANNLGFMRMYCDGGELCKEYWDFVFEGSKDIQSSIQIQRVFLAQAQADRVERRLPPLLSLKVWADNASDFKGGDMWDQWQKQLREDAPGNDLEVVELNYHAAGEGKTALDAHFGHLNTLRRKRERMKLERRTVGDLLIAMADAQATHVVHVELDREQESRFYKTAEGISSLHRVVVEPKRMQMQKDSKSPLMLLELDKVKERKTKRSQALRARDHGQRTHMARADECQKCHNQLKKGESLDGWIQCEGCVRSWHKTCVGIDASTPVDDVEWNRCSGCDGADPEGDVLVKRRKVAVCIVCGDRKRGIDHTQCRQDKGAQAAAFQTPMARMLAKSGHDGVDRKVFAPPKGKRAQRKRRTRRKHKGSVVTPEEFDELKQHI